MHRGYTKRWRKRWDKGYHYDPDLWLLMSYFIDFANYKDSEVYFPNAGLIPLKRGQHIFGTPQLSAFLGWDRNRTRRKLKILKNINFLTIQTTNRYSIATVINYNTYQPTDHENDQPENQQPTSRRPADDQQMTTPNKVKNSNKDKKGNKKESRKSKKQTFDPQSIPYLLSETLLKQITINQPDFKPAQNGIREKTLQQWSIDIDRMIRIDKRNPCAIWNMIIWCQHDDFWPPNIQSGSKLRQKYDQLAGQINREYSKKKTTQHDQLLEVGQKWLEKQRQKRNGL